MTDDAHGLGVVGGGRGSSFLGAVKSDVPLQMGTLSKAIGAYGGYLCASQPVIDLIRNRGRSFVYSTGLPPGTLAAAIKALEIIERDPALCARPVENAALFCTALGLPTPVSPIVPVILGEARRVMEASAALQERGFLVTGIRPPTVPEGTARLRVTFSAAHTVGEIDGLIAAMRELGLAG
jgi:8-amino-7-oxononanoate synthase